MLPVKEVRLLPAATANPKKNVLRFAEYYNLQDTFDDLYSLSKQGHSFSNLYDIIIDERNIQLAYRTIKSNRGSKTSGVNRKTIIDWHKSNADNYVGYIRKRLQNFHPHRVKRGFIPKKDGKMRLLGIPTMEDRLVQQCILQVLQPILEAKFYRASFGFRPNRSCKHAIAELSHKVNIAKLYFIVDVDIKGFFDNINHGKLLKQLWALGIRDKRLLAIISKMLKAEIEGEGIPEKGTPQGGILSPILANVALNELDWWIDSQWKSFEAKEIKLTARDGKTQNYNKLAKLRTTTRLKEVYIVRYADDFKLMCRTMESAERMYKATELWLKDRLGLEVNEEKSKIIDIRKQASEFLGFSLKAKPKGKTQKGETKYVIHSHMTEMAIKQTKEDFRTSILEISKHPTPQNVLRYNSMVIGKQNYYDTATHCNLDFGKIEFSLMVFRHNRLKNVMSKKGKLSAAYIKRYNGYNYRKQYVADLILFPIPAVRHKTTMLFTQEICDYTPEGRALIHANLRISMNVMHHLMNNPPKNASIQLLDNRLSLFSAQKGQCAISGKALEISYMEIHHKIPVQHGGSDEYKNLVWLTYEVHKLVHATEEETIQKYLKLVNLNPEQLKKLNKFRVKAGNSVIEQK